MITTTSTATVKVFNQGILDIHDPTDFAGVRQPKFSIAHTYVVDKAVISTVCNDLYMHVLEKLQSEAVGKVSLRTTDYLDSRYQGKEPPRKYIVVESNTARGTNSKIFIRFLPFGDNMYVGVDSYVLGEINWFGFLFQVFITFVPLLAIMIYLSITAMLSSFTNPFAQRQSSGGGIGSGLFCCLVPAVLFILLLWVNVFRAFKQHGDLALAIRQNFNNAPNDQSFNVDDILMFFKSSLPLVVFSVREVFQRHNLPIESLDDFVTNVNNVVNISSGGGILSIIGSAIGGQNNRVSS